MGSLLTYFFNNADDGIVDSNGLTKRQKKLVRETWSVLRQDLVNTGVTVMLRYFREYPEYHQMFPPFRDISVDDLVGNKRFHAHCQGIFNILNNAIDALDDPDLLNAVLHTTGARHGQRGQHRPEFLAVKGVTIDVMKSVFKSKFNDEVEAAWSKTLDIILGKIIEGIEGTAS